MSASGSRIRLQVFELQLQGEDRLTVGNGDNPGDVTSVILSRKDIVMPQFIMSAGSSLWLTFDTDGSVITRSVFKLEVQEFNVTGNYYTLVNNEGK